MREIIIKFFQFPKILLFFSYLEIQLNKLVKFISFTKNKLQIKLNYLLII